MKSTFEKDIKNHHFKSWPGLTPEILKHIPKTVATVQGYMHQEQQNFHSTKIKSLNPKSMEAKHTHFQRLKDKKQPGQFIKYVLLKEMDEDSFPASQSSNKN